VAYASPSIFHPGSTQCIFRLERRRLTILAAASLMRPANFAIFGNNRPERAKHKEFPLPLWLIMAPVRQKRLEAPCFVAIVPVNASSPNASWSNGKRSSLSLCFSEASSFENNSYRCSVSSDYYSNTGSSEDIPLSGLDIFH